MDLEFIAEHIGDLVVIGQYDRLLKQRDIWCDLAHACDQDLPASRPVLVMPEQVHDQNAHGTRYWHVPCLSRPSRRLVPCGAYRRGSVRTRPRLGATDKQSARSCPFVVRCGAHRSLLVR